MAAQLINIRFHDQTLTAAMIDGLPYVAMKPICENIGLDRKAQQDRIKRHPVLNSVRVMTTLTGSDGKQYEMLMLPLDYLNGWLFGVDASRVKPEIKPRLLDYQRECFKVLAKHFMPKRNGLKRGQAENPELLHVTPLELDALIKQRAEKLVEGEVVFKEKDCPEYHYPITDWQPKNRVGNGAHLTFSELFRVDPGQRCTSRLFKQHIGEGDDVSGAAAEVDALYLLLESFYIKLDRMASLLGDVSQRGLNIRLG